ncbi:NDR1/HIN1-like protein 3 [Prunus yedoensis var. nudiflora]|uniref:NDR1/HIN1-like protein 3 n=1 Tax=Prunus yedoensis var. nudiflora TaxID=2094558 RepID=A0A314ZLN8_PRUYE|nr:NDR1/HIN1-like protein 3 [Prunus yedoensis var. nudiflora]
MSAKDESFGSSYLPAFDETDNLKITKPDRHYRDSHPPKFAVENASLSQFNYTKTNHILSYSLALNITITNPKKYIGLEYNDIQVIAYYGKTRFAFVTLVNETASFYQNPNTTVSFENVAVRGHKLVLFAESDFNKYSLGTAADVYSVDLLIAFKETFVSGNAICNLKLPLGFNGTAAPGFQATKCWRRRYY